MATPDISIITTAYNAMPYLARTLDSVLEQTLDAERIEVVAVDDGSTDGTSEELDRFAAQHANVRVVHLEENSGGPSRPRNVGLDNARGHYVLFLDSDDHMAPEALERMLAMAEEHSSDVLLGRVIGTGGRSSPMSMFRNDQPRADLFESNVYRTLNVFKLFRRELVERLGLRFDEGMNCGEDQPFTAAAYLNADTISVLASYKCIFWHLREDGQNNSTRRQDLMARSDVVEVMLTLLAEQLDPGPRRDRLASRHFELDALVAMRCLLAEPSRDRQLQAIDRMQGWIAEHYTENVEESMPVFPRVCHALVRDGRLDELLELLRYEQRGETPAKVVRDGRLFVAYPFFGDPDVGLPDSCFEESDRVAAWRRLETAEWRGPVLRIEAHARLTRVWDATPRASIVLQRRDSDEERVVSCEQEEWPETDGGLRLACDIDMRSAASGEPLGRGLWDLHVRLDHHGLVRDGRLGASRCESLDTRARARCVDLGRDLREPVVSYFTQGYSNLTLDVGDLNSQIGPPLQIGTVAWAENGRPALTVEASSPLGNLPSKAVALELLAAETIYLVECASTETAEGSRLAASVELAHAADGKPLPAAAYELRLTLSCGETSAELPVPVREELPTLRWWRKGIPYHARCSKDAKKPLTLTITRVRLLRAIQRRVAG
jgi:CDP-glycerol glycerophosphotransferase